MGSTTITTITVSEKKARYATESDWRTATQLTDTSEFPSAMVLEKLDRATEKLKKDAFVNVRLEFVVKDANSRYFLSRRWLANAYGTNVAHGVVTPRDLRVWESDETSSVSSAFFLQGSRINRLISQIPQEAITDMDSINGYFKLNDSYPSDSNHRIFADYWICGKPLNEIQTELKEATIAWATVLILTEYKKTKRMKNAVISLSQGNRSIQRNEQEFDAFVRQWYNDYHSKINWFRPFFGRKVTIGKYGERHSGNSYTSNSGRGVNYY